MIPTFTDRQLRTIFYPTWLILLLVQCALVGLSGDEAYYWRYSTQLAWGYFDHPPVTALLTKAGSLLIPGELGVRFFFALLSTAMIYALEKLVQPANLKLFYTIVLSVAFLHVGMVWGGGMMALPDIPLLFFEAIFFLLYRKYLDNPQWYVYALMPVVTALMLMSKYHGVLVIGFVVLSNLALLRRPSAWLMALATGLLILPHLAWQVVNDFPSMRYHFLERSTNPYEISFTLEYLAAQPFILGPLVSVILIYCAIVFHSLDRFERALQFTALGTYAFFLLMTFKGRVEGNWTFIALVPLVYLGYKRIEAGHPTLRKLTRISFVISIALILVARVIIIAKLPLGKFTEALSPEVWTSELRKKSADMPVGFVNSYQKAALYEFYEGIPSFSLNNFWGRKNQYTRWDTEASYQGKDVSIVANWNIPAMDSIRIDGDYYPVRHINNFRSSSNLWILTDLNGPLHVKGGGTLAVKLSFHFTNREQRDLEANKDFPTAVAFGFFRGTQARHMGYTELVVRNDMIRKGTYSIQIQLPAEPGQYSLFFGAATGWLPPGINSSPLTVVVE